MFWWMDVAGNWSTFCQERHRAVFWARGCSFCTPQNFFPFWRISLLVNGYADDSTLMAVVPSTGTQVTVAESLNRDLIRVNAWCDLWGMKLNASKTKTLIVSRSRTMHPQSPPLRGPYRQVIGGSSFFLMSFKNCIVSGTTSENFRSLPTMKIVPMARI